MPFVVVIDTMNNFTNGTDLYQPWSVPEKCVLLILYISAILLCAVGNAVAIVVFIKGHRSRSDIRNFFVCLSVADLLVGIFCLPFTFVLIFMRYWALPAILCPVVLYLQLLSVTVSVATNMVIGLDRLWMILAPLHSRITKSRSKLVIAGIWGISAFLSSVQLAVARAKPEGGQLSCSERWPNETMQKAYTILVIILNYGLPLSVLAVTYSVVGVRVWKRRPPGVVDSRQALRHLSDKRKTIKMLVVIVLFFGICWLPLHLFFIIGDFAPDVMKAAPDTLVRWVYTLAHWFAMANSFVNPIIYGFMNQSFREDLIYMVRRCSLRDNNSEHRSHSYATARRSRAYCNSMCTIRFDNGTPL